MLKKTYSVEGFDGSEVVVCYFNLTTAEVLEMEAEFDGGLAAHLTRIGNSGDNLKILECMKWLISKSYGRRVDNEFVKTEQISANFSRSEAYSELLLELLQGGEKAMIEFLEGIIPKKLQGNISQAPTAPSVVEQRLSQAVAAQQEVPKPKLPEKPRMVTISPLGAKKFNEYTREELMRLPAEEYDRLWNELLNSR